MKKSELRQIVKEEIKKSLNEQNSQVVDFLLNYFLKEFSKDDKLSDVADFKDAKVKKLVKEIINENWSDFYQNIAESVYAEYE